MCIFLVLLHIAVWCTVHTVLKYFILLNNLSCLKNICFICWPNSIVWLYRDSLKICLYSQKFYVYKQRSETFWCTLFYRKPLTIGAYLNKKFPASMYSKFFDQCIHISPLLNHMWRCFSAFVNLYPSPPRSISDLHIRHTCLQNCCFLSGFRFVVD